MFAKWKPLIISGALSPFYLIVGAVVATFAHGNPIGAALFFPFSLVQLLVLQPEYPNGLTLLIAFLHLPIYGLIVSLSQHRLIAALIVACIHIVVGFLTLYLAISRGLL